ncbi:MAG: hypothetical protein SXA11_02170 [Cyanobacteriota bacterium]|nr:hypothetical protein [Cyanobacteriota bacterium]
MLPTFCENQIFFFILILLDLVLLKVPGKERSPAHYIDDGKGS